MCLQCLCMRLHSLTLTKIAHSCQGFAEACEKHRLWGMEGCWGVGGGLNTKLVVPQILLYAMVAHFSRLLGQLEKVC